MTVELKPKWGFLPSSPFLDQRTAEVKRSVCRYCMHQTLKAQRGDGQSRAHQPHRSGRCSAVANASAAAGAALRCYAAGVCGGSVDRRSGFCPLDLFSCDPVRVRSAVRALLRVSRAEGEGRKEKQKRGLEGTDPSESEKTSMGRADLPSLLLCVSSRSSLPVDSAQQPPRVPSLRRRRSGEREESAAPELSGVARPRLLSSTRPPCAVWCSCWSCPMPLICPWLCACSASLLQGMWTCRLLSLPCWCRWSAVHHSAASSGACRSCRGRQTDGTWSSSIGCTPEPAS